MTQVPQPRLLPKPKSLILEMKLIVESQPVNSTSKVIGQLQVDHVPTLFFMDLVTAIMLKLKATSILPSRETYLQAMVLIICAINVRQADNIHHIAHYNRPLSTK